VTEEASPVPRAWLVALAAAVLAVAAVRASTVFLDVPAEEGPSFSVFELDANEYASPGRLRARGLELAPAQGFTIAYAPIPPAIARGAAAIGPAHRTVRWVALAVWAVAALVLAHRAARRRARPLDLLWLAAWALFPVAWSAAQVGLAELYVGAALALALAAFPASGWTGSAWLRGAAMGPALACKFYGWVPLGIAVLLVAVRDRRLAAAATIGTVAVAVAAGVWLGTFAILGTTAEFAFSALAEASRHYGSVGDPPLRRLEAVLLTPFRYPGGGTTSWIVVVLGLRLAHARRALDPGRFWAWLLAPLPALSNFTTAYRLIPLLLAAPALLGGRREERGRAAAWVSAALDVMLAAILVQLPAPGALEGRPRVTAVVAVALAAGAALVLRRIGRDARARLGKATAAVAAAGIAAVVVFHVAWEVDRARNGTSAYDDSARRTAERAPHARTVAGCLPELWCRYLEDAKTFPIDGTMPASPPESARTADVVVLLPTTGTYARRDELLEGAAVEAVPLLDGIGRLVDVLIGVRRAPPR